MPITALYAALLTPLLVFLSVRVIGARRRARVAIGHGDDAELLRAMRVQANFAEYVPLALILMALAESMSANALLLHTAGLALLAGRASHAYGVSQQQETLAFRATGTATTFFVLALLAATCAYYSADRLS